MFFLFDEQIHELSCMQKGFHRLEKHAVMVPRSGFNLSI